MSVYGKNFTRFLAASLPQIGIIISFKRLIDIIPYIRRFGDRFFEKIIIFFLFQHKERFAVMAL